MGWYHSHPGFGVEFSELDVFIQRNFFSSPTQIALVMDPLDGQVAVCINTPRGIEYLPRYWVDGREHISKVPARLATSSDGISESATPARAAGGDVQLLEQRVGQLAQAVDELRNSLYRHLMLVGSLAAVAILVVAGFAIFQMMKTRLEPPKNVGFAEVPVQIGDQTALLGVQIVKWQLPPEMDIMKQAVDLAAEQLRRELEEAAALLLTNAPVSAATNPPSLQPKSARP